MSLYILEGPDGAGKTTLAKSLEGLEYVHFGPPPKGKNAAWHQYYALLVDLWDNHRPGGVVVDRFIHGELIYGPILRGGTDLTWAHVRMLERVLMGLEAQLVICLPPWEMVKENWLKDIDNELIKDADDLYDVYSFYWHKLLGDPLRMLPRKFYDFTDHTPMMIKGETFKNEGPGIGLFCPGNVLLVGEEVNVKKGKDGWPFVAPDSSSLWLAQQLEEAKIPESRLYWVNSVTHGNWLDPRFVDKLEPSKIIAMGGKAQMWCRNHKLQHEAIAHPQWHKRFRHNERYPLLDLGLV